jgi:hypothetical protein
MANKLKVIIGLLLLQMLLASCNNEHAPECFKSMGDKVSYTVKVDSFTGIHISPGIELVVKQGTETAVIIETGEYIKEYVTVEVKDNTLWISNSNNCNWTRDYKSTTVYITTPVLEKIYSASQFAVKSDGVLSFPSLVLQSGLNSETASGTFELEVNCDNLVVEDNQDVYCVIKGKTQNLSVNFYSGDARFDGTNLEVQNLGVFHRSSNDIIAAPQQRASGTLYSTGNLVLKTHPPVVEVEQLYKGEVVYE